MNYSFYMSSGQIMGFKFVTGDIAQAGFVGFNHARYDNIRRNITDAHQKKLYQSDVYSRNFGGQPKEEWYVMKEKNQENNTSRYQ